MSESESRRIVIFDTTLRDGEQSPGASMNLAEKMEAAQALVDLGVDVIEAGFPIASPGDFEAVREIAKAVRGPAVRGCPMPHCDIDRAWELSSTPSTRDPRVPRHRAAIHREHKLKMGKRRSSSTQSPASAAAGYCSKSNFAEDAARTEEDFAAWSKRRSARATTVNIPDTVGYATPAHMGRGSARLATRSQYRPAIISVHCHNDLAWPANSLPPSRPRRRSNARSTASASGR